LGANQVFTPVFAALSIEGIESEIKKISHSSNVARKYSRFFNTYRGSFLPR
jgi:hypothetical protein